MQNKVTHWIVSIFVYGLPLVLASHSPTLDLTLGTILNGLYLYLSQVVNPTAPVSEPSI